MFRLFPQLISTLFFNVSPMQEVDSDIYQVHNLICPKSNEVETMDNENRLVRRLRSNMVIGCCMQLAISRKSAFMLECVTNYTINKDDEKIVDYVFNATRDPLGT